MSSLVGDAGRGGDTKMSKVFLSYRREDSQDVTGRIYDRLVAEFAASSVFKDVDNIPLGLDFRTVLNEAVGQAGVVLVIIGPSWLTTSDAEGRRRLDSPIDFVRLEVQAALENGGPVIPVLVGHTRMPTPNELPDDLKPLAFRNGMSVRPDPDFHNDMERLASALEQWIARPTSSGRPAMNRAIDEISRQLEVERIDREWAIEREKYLITVIRNQTIIDGQATGGYPAREVPTQTGSIVGGLIAIPFGLFGAGFFSYVGMSLFGAKGAGLAIFPLLFLVISLFSFSQAYRKAREYERAEAIYQTRRATALGNLAKAED